MNRNLIAMTSITYAMKAKTILNGKGYYCEITRTPKNMSTGCGYSIIIQNDHDEITKILDEHDIKYKEVLS